MGHEIGPRERQRLASIGGGGLPDDRGELCRLLRPALRNPRRRHGARRTIPAPACEALRQVLAAPTQPTFLQQHHQPRGLLAATGARTVEHRGGLVRCHRQAGDGLPERRNPTGAIERAQSLQR